MPESPEVRSRIMRAIPSRNTTPERRVRALLRELGYGGYRLHREDLPGAPDIAFIGRRKAIFVHGCFWHGHDCRRGRRQPVNNAEYWQRKIAGNVARDARHCSALSERCWAVLVVWECELRAPAGVRARLNVFMAEAPTTMSTS